MKANELRIGNFVMDKSGKPVVLLSLGLREEGIAAVSKIDDNRFAWINAKIDLFPIPLTEEWLLKFGVFSQNGTFAFDFKPAGEVIRTNIKYVHQLQNLYFALTGTELEIKSDMKTKKKFPDKLKSIQVDPDSGYLLLNEDSVKVNHKEDFKERLKKALDSIDLPDIKSESGKAVEIDMKEVGDAMIKHMESAIKKAIDNHPKTLTKSESELNEAIKEASNELNKKLDDIAEEFFRGKNVIPDIKIDTITGPGYGDVVETFMGFAARIAIRGREGLELKRDRVCVISNGKIKEGDIIKFIMPAFCSGDYVFEVTHDKEFGLILKDAPPKIFEGCYSYKIMRNGKEMRL